MLQIKKIISAAVFFAVFAVPLLLAQGLPSFSGVWQLSNERNQPARKGDVTLKVDHIDPELTVETTVLRSPGRPPRNAKQRYSTDGKQTTTIGADGDEFLTSVVWKGAYLVFTIEEHEDGQTIRSKETWSLIEGGAALQRVREGTDGTIKQTLIYLRQSAGS